MQRIADVINGKVEAIIHAVVEALVHASTVPTPLLDLLHLGVTLNRQRIPIKAKHSSSQALEVVDIEMLTLTMLRVVADRDVGALRDVVNKLSRICIDTTVISRVHQVVVVTIERSS